MRVKRKTAILGALVVVLLSLCLGIWLAGTILSRPAHQEIGSLPADLPGKPVQFQSESGATIHGWLIPGKRDTGAIVLMHGVRANRLSMVDRARFLSRAGYAVLLFDFQAHGESTGNQITFGYLESRDARAAVAFLRTAAPGERIGVIGISMGGAAALLASPKLEVDAMVLEMVYPTIDQAISDRIGARVGRWARILTPVLSWQLKPRLGISTNDLRPIDRVGVITAPKLFIAGAEDRYTPLEESREIYSAAGEPKDLWIVNGAGHQDVYPIAGPEYERRVLAFFGPHLRSTAGP